MKDQTEHGTYPPAFKYLVIATVVAGLAVIGSLAAMTLRHDRQGRPTLEPDPAFAGIGFPSFAGVNQASSPTDATLLDGQVTIVDFMFTHCPLVCPEMSTRMMELNNTLVGSDVKFLSISVDPEHDTPEALAEFADRYQANPKRWTFVRTSPEDLDHVARTLGFALQEGGDVEIPLASGGTMANIIHPTEMFLVGPDRTIYGRYFYKSEDDLAQIVDDARTLLESK